MDGKVTCACSPCREKEEEEEEEKNEKLKRATSVCASVSISDKPGAEGSTEETDGGGAAMGITLRGRG